MIKKQKESQGDWSQRTSKSVMVLDGWSVGSEIMQGRIDLRTGYLSLFQGQEEGKVARFLKISLASWKQIWR